MRNHVKLEEIMLSKISLSQKDKYCYATYLRPIK